MFRTKNARRAPFYIISAGNAVLMTVVIILHDICDNSPTCVRSFAKVMHSSSGSGLRCAEIIAVDPDPVGSADPEKIIPDSK